MLLQMTGTRPVFMCMARPSPYIELHVLRPFCGVVRPHAWAGYDVSRQGLFCAAGVRTPLNTRAFRHFGTIQSSNKLQPLVRKPGNTSRWGVLPVGPCPKTSKHIEKRFSQYLVFSQNPASAYRWIDCCRSWVYNRGYLVFPATPRVLKQRVMGLVVPLLLRE